MCPPPPPLPLASMVLMLAGNLYCTSLSPILLLHLLALLLLLLLRPRVSGCCFSVILSVLILCTGTIVAQRPTSSSKTPAATSNYRAGRALVVASERASARQAICWDKAEEAEVSNRNLHGTPWAVDRKQPEEERDKRKQEEKEEEEEEEEEEETKDRTKQGGKTATKSDEGDAYIDHRVWPSSVEYHTPAAAVYVCALSLSVVDRSSFAKVSKLTQRLHTSIIHPHPQICRYQSRFPQNPLHPSLPRLSRSRTCNQQ
ncbi:uncharacterized protein LY79DRAFT_566776 [Colletotrichum navitas]|uniref:Uncharacterized protein n=1 Tax=Colletotrichum navitas TaxID=681940 RepID=A0AAD8UYR2_9PEZI|nr:uncharacterized protein LY79DRAFT_566776 [Colletotrichum navitas]KAK1574106.1 hypothetical protein LY79DRAFT_566776 [Colletotrichum navitas]